MTPYELVVVSASRPHLLQPTIASLWNNLAQLPDRILVHDDAVFPGRAGEMEETMEMIRRLLPKGAAIYRQDAPPIRHGPALKWLLDQVRTEFVLYSQDDFETIRPLPIVEALEEMAEVPNWINQIRFNKRATRAYKDTWQGPWYKKEYQTPSGRIITVSDHWYFQTGLWRTSFIRNAVDMCARYDEELHRRSIEEAVNRHFDLKYCNDPRSPKERAEYDSVGTFIWGPIGEDRYIRHIGDKPEDWAGDHAR